MRRKLVFDIETLGVNFQNLDERSKKYLEEWARRDASTDEEFNEALLEKERSLALHPTTAEVVAIAVYNPDTARGAVYFLAPKKTESFSEGNVDFKGVASEKEIIEWWWQTAKDYEEFISFNGRTFDVPFLMIRSAILGVKPTVDLMKDNRYMGERNIDLLDRLTFFGAVRRRPNLHFWAKAFGIESPKEDFGWEEIKGAFERGEYRKIAQYCLNDVLSTAKLYDFWNRYLRNI